MPSRRLLISSVVLLLAHQHVQAICLNPLGCEPQTQQECIGRLTGTHTETVAKAQLAQCYKLSRVNQALCEKTEAQWSDYMRVHAGKEWDWAYSDWSTKQECRKQFPRMFSASKWVSKSYCAAAADQIRRNLDLVDIESGNSKTLDEVRRKLPELSQLNDRSFVDALKQLYYPNMSAAEVAGRLGIDAPVDALNVALECNHLSGGKSMVEWIAAEIVRRYNANTAGLRDPGVARTDAVAKGREVVLRYVMKPAPAANFTSLRDEVVSKTCRVNASNPAFKDGLFYTFEYSDTRGRELSRFSVGAAQCRM